VSEAGMKTIIDAVAWIVTIGIAINVAFLFCNLKIYTEITKEKSQRSRRGDGNDK
jgi:hypothetical protein